MYSGWDRHSSRFWPSNSNVDIFDEVDTCNVPRTLASTDRFPDVIERSSPRWRSMLPARRSAIHVRVAIPSRPHSPSPPSRQPLRPKSSSSPPLLISRRRFPCTWLSQIADAQNIGVPCCTRPRHSYEMQKTIFEKRENLRTKADAQKCYLSDN